MRTMNYYTNKIIEMSFTPLLSFSRKRESRRRLRESWEPEDKKILDARLKTSGMTENQARDDRREHICTNKKGVTLIELVITMVLIGIIAYIVATALSTGITAYFTTDFRKEALDQARIAMERMTREIRNVRSNSDIWASSDATRFCFTNTDGTTISFRYPGNTVIREEGLANLAACPGAAGDTLSNNIANLTFSYIRADGTVDAVFSSVNTKRIRITFTATISGEAVALQSEVWPRSL